MKTGFIGHRKILERGVYDKLDFTIEMQINNGCKSFIMGSHGKFDELALFACLDLKRDYKDIEIEVVLTRLSKLYKQSQFDLSEYSQVNTIMFDIEEVHYKQQITLSNKLMIDLCDTLICYVDNSTGNSGARSAIKYAQKNGRNIINLY